MKKQFLPIFALALAITAAGCSSGTSSFAASSAKASSAQTSSESVITVENVPEIDSDASMVVPMFNFEPLKTALADQNFILKDETYNGAAMTLTAEGESGSFDVRAEKFENADDATKGYAQAISQLENESYQLVNAYTNDATDLTVLMNDVNTVYALVGVDKEANDLYVMQDILEGAEPTVLEVMKNLGFKTE